MERRNPCSRIVLWRSDNSLHDPSIKNEHLITIFHFILPTRNFTCQFDAMPSRDVTRASCLLSLGIYYYKGHAVASLLIEAYDKP
jgi:hypothetical protein